jgi:hypothetical protein
MGLTRLDTRGDASSQKQAQMASLCVALGVDPFRSYLHVPTLRRSADFAPGSAWLTESVGIGLRKSFQKQSRPRRGSGGRHLMPQTTCRLPLLTQRDRGPVAGLRLACACCMLRWVGGQSALASSSGKLFRFIGRTHAQAWVSMKWVLLWRTFLPDSQTADLALTLRLLPLDT